MKQKSKTKFNVLLALSFAILLIILFFGLRGKDYSFTNDVSWLKDGPGLRFGNYGMAYAVLDDRIKNDISKRESFSLETAIKPENFKPQGFYILLSLHDGRDSDQLIVGQYQTYLVVMNSDDYPHTRKVKRIAARIFNEPLNKRLLTITSGQGGTKLYVDGRLIQSKPDLILKIPAKNKLRITLGNTVYGSSPWRGELYGLAFYPYELASETIENRFKTWAASQLLPFSKAENPVLFFALNERKGTQAIDQVTGTEKLNIPNRFHILEKRFLTLPGRDFKVNGSFFSDFTINLLGFMPLGFILCALLMECGPFRNKAIFASVLLCFLISLFIEIVQAWMPSRNSQLMDLILNTSGALIAAVVYRRLFHKNKLEAAGPTKKG